MASLRQQFDAWRSNRAEDAVAVKLLREDIDSSGLVLEFHFAAGSSVLMLPVEGGSFFAEGLDDPPEAVEDWLTHVNGHFADKASLALDGALDFMLAQRPKASGDDDDAGMEEDDDSDDMTCMEPIVAAEQRESQRAAVSEEQRWEDTVRMSAVQGSRQASQVLMREMRTLMALRGDEGEKAMEIDMVQDSLYRWSVTMRAKGFPEGCILRRELEDFGVGHTSGVAAVIMDVHFPSTFPMEPPFIRVVRPRFQMHTGHITIGGSVCMQLLTASGWLPSLSLENIFVSIRSEMVEGGGRLECGAARYKDYTEAEAHEAFHRVAARYGWNKT